MAHFYPVSIEHLPAAHDAEKRVWSSLTALGNEYHVFHSVSFAKNNIDYECDFVIVHELYGFLCVEVKGGGIHCDNGQWFSSNALGVHAIKNPFTQARNAMFALKDLFAKKSGRMFTGVFGRCVMFPDCAATVDSVLPMERSAVLDIEDLKHAPDHLDSLFSEYCRNHSSKFLPADFSALIELLKGDISLPFAVQRAIVERETHLSRMDDIQEYVLDLFEDKNRIAFQGAAGTGKTFLAMKKAKRLAAANKKVLFLCFNKRLAAMIGDSLQNDALIPVMTFNAFARKLVQEAIERALLDDVSARAIGALMADLYRMRHGDSSGETPPRDRSPEERARGILSLCVNDSGEAGTSGNATADLLRAHRDSLPANVLDLFCFLLGDGDPWRERIPLALMHIMESGLIDDSSFIFDALIIDEGQDFEKSWCDCLQMIFEKYRSRIVYLFYDDNQNIFTKYKNLPVTDLVSKSSLANFVFRLRDNLRNTSQIHDYAISHSNRGVTSKALDVNGLSPFEKKVSSPAAVISCAAEILDELFSVHHIDLSRVVIVSNRSIENTPFACKKIGGFSCVASGEGKQKMAVRFRTIHEFKGLEADIVILYIQNTDDERLNAAQYLSEEIRYVGYTRAKCMLYVIEREEICPGK